MSKPDQAVLFDPLLCKISIMLAVSDVHPRNLAVDFLTHEIASVNVGIPLCHGHAVTRRHQYKISKLRYASVYVTAKPYKTVLFDPLLCKNSFNDPC